MSHDHHSHHHHHQRSTDFGRAFALGIALNSAFVLIEAFYGWHTGSLALLADAGHNLSDVAGLLLAWAALVAGRLRPDNRHTYGWRRGSILASFINAFVLLLGMLVLAWEAVQRLRAPVPLDGMTIMVVAGIGVAVNGITAALFAAGSKKDLNIRGAFLHMAADALVSLGVVLAGAMYLWQGWTWLDPVVSLLVAVVIVYGSWSLLRQSLHLMFDGVPEGIDLTAVRHRLEGLPGVVVVHDLHVWALDSAEPALTAHLVLADVESDADGVLIAATKALHEHFDIEHITLQIESRQYAVRCHAAGGYCGEETMAAHH